MPLCLAQASCLIEALMNGVILIVYWPLGKKWPKHLLYLQYSAGKYSRVQLLCAHACPSQGQTSPGDGELDSCDATAEGTSSSLAIPVLWSRACRQSRHAKPAFPDYERFSSRDNAPPTTTTLKILSSSLSFSMSVAPPSPWTFSSSSLSPSPGVPYYTLLMYIWIGY